jgi:hypothetical protein
MTPIEAYLLNMRSTSTPWCAAASHRLRTEISATNHDSRALERLGRYTLAVVAADAKTRSISLTKDHT